jgi:hypothetical protein
MRSHICAMLGGSIDVQVNVTEGLLRARAHGVLSDGGISWPFARSENDKEELCKGNGKLCGSLLEDVDAQAM